MLHAQMDGRVHGNRVLVGAAMGVGLAFGISRREERAVPDSNDLKGVGALVLGGLSIVPLLERERIGPSRSRDKPAGGRRVRVPLTTPPASRSVALPDAAS